LPGNEEKEEEAPTSTRRQQNNNKFSGAVAGEERRLLQGECRTHILYFVLSFSLLYFYLHRLFKNTKKLVPTIVVIFVGLLLSCFIMLSINGWFL
jgi:hypothetical protein